VTTLLKTVPNLELDKTKLTDLIEVFMREAQNGWLEMEWYQNIQPISGSENEAEDIDDDEEAAEEDEEEGGPVTSAASQSREKRKANHLDSLAAPKRAFGTMMTDATDWLSDDRRAAYSEWKARIIKKIERMERGNQKV
jgi:origin recognition complex subunit 6